MTIKALATCNDNLREIHRNKYVNRFSTMGRLAKYRNYYNEYDGSKIVERVDNFDFRHEKLRNVIKYDKENCGGILPIKPNKIAKIVGVFKGKLRRMEFIPKYKPDYVSKLYLQTVDQDFNEECVNNDVFVKPGSFRYNSQNLRDMATDHIKKYSYDELIDGYISRLGHDLLLPKIDHLRTSYVNGIRTKRDSFPGILTSLSFGAKRKNSIPFTKGVAEKYLEQIVNSERQILDCSYLHVGGREKRITCERGVVKPNIKTRVTLCQEDIPTLISTTLSKTLNESFQKLDKGFNYAGRVNGRLNHRRLAQELSIDDRFDLNFNVDFSGHDNNVSEEAVVTAFAVLRLCFDEHDVKIDRWFHYVLSSCVFKRIVLPESRLIYQISKGIASGHGMTNMINTLCAFGTFATAINNLHLSEDLVKRTYVVLAGDDTIGKLPIEIITDLSNEIKYNSGMKVDDVINTSGHVNSHSNSSRNTFLKKKYLTHGISWNNLELFKNISYPTSTKLDSYRNLDHLTTMNYMAPFDVDLRNILINLIIIKFYDIAISTHKWDMKTGPPPCTLLDFFNFNVPVSDSVTIFKPGKNLAIPDIYLWHEFACTNVKASLRHIINDHLNKFWQSYNVKLRWFDLHRVFKSHENSIRLKVFDVNKIYRSGKIYHDIGKISKIYGSF